MIVQPTLFSLGHKVEGTKRAVLLRPVEDS